MKVLAQKGIDLSSLLVMARICSFHVSLSSIVTPKYKLTMSYLFHFILHYHVGVMIHG